MRVRSLPPWICVLAASLGLSGRFVIAADAPKVAESPAAKAIKAATYQGQIVPLLQKYCVNCHGRRKPKGDLDFTLFGDESSVTKDRKLWQRVSEYVEAGDMPPEGQPSPTAEEAELLAGWIDARLSSFDCAKDADPGRVTVRRLNRSEYNNTIRDLVGVDFHPADDFPSDDVGYGFDNIGDVLTLSPILMEKYLAAAETIAEQAIVAGPAPKPATRTYAATELDVDPAVQRISDSTCLLYYSTARVGVSHPFPRDGEYLVRVRAYGHQAGSEPARMAIEVDGTPVQTVDVAAEEDKPRVYEVRARIPAGRHRVSAAFVNDYYDPDFADAKRRDRNLAIDYLEVFGPVATDAALPESHRRIIFRTPTADTRYECAREIIDRFASRAYRRPVTPAEVARLIKLVELVQEQGDGFERGIQLAVEAVLASPQFLFRVELDPRRKFPTDPAPPSTHPIDEFELASRLSYFLWSSMPDDELRRLAAEGKLREGDNLEGQVRRMIRDPRSRAMVENFADQWLQIRLLNTINPDKALFPSFDDSLRSAMMKETELFFESVMRDDRSVLDFIDADYTFLNERLAKHYGIGSVQGEEFRRVTFRDGDRRGGLLTQASVLTATSNATRTSPVKRGRWILEQILGTPPPPPPPNVPELKEGAELTGTLRQRMEQHRSNASCAVCHAKMDPLGFGFENYDAIGAWRDRDGGEPIDSSGTLPSGQTFRGPSELKTILKGRDREFVRCLSEKMLTYAIGRGLDYYDTCALDKVVEETAGDGHKFTRIVLEIVRSDPFQKRKTREGTR